MARRKRPFGRRARSKSLLGSLGTRLDTKGNGKHAALETGKDFVLSVLVGGVVAAIIGKPSLLVGAGVTGLGHYLGSPVASHIGVGMMASTVGSMMNGTGVSGIDGLDGVKERLAAFRKSLAERTYIDKIFKRPADVAGAPVGDLQYFDYGRMAGILPQRELYGEMGEPDDLAALDDIERQIERAGIERLQGLGMTGLAALNVPDEQVASTPTLPPITNTVTGTEGLDDFIPVGNLDPMKGVEDDELAQIGSTTDEELLGDVSEFNY